jgi:RNA polymerase sigma-70 factor (ECF subfamily)
MPRLKPRRRRSAAHLVDALSSGDAYRAAEHAAREHYSRVLASLAAQFRDVTAAEDALADSLVAALAQWPASGVPDEPAAWLLTVARRRLSDGLRRRATADAATEQLVIDAQRAGNPSAMTDRRLELLFACAHPAIAEDVRAPLMLQVVFGFDAGDIAAVFLSTPSAMAQRLVRAKHKIRDAQIPFHIPDPKDYAGRLAFVLTAIYAVFTRDGTHWHETSGRRDSLADEAIWLGHLVVGLSKREPEALGLLALMLFVESRRSARRDDCGRYVPLSEQPVELWDEQLIGRAENLLREAAGKKSIGRFQLEAAIQSVHAARMKTRETDWSAVLALYDALLALGDSFVARINRAVAVSHVRGAEAALAELECVSMEPRVQVYQPYWAARAHLLAETGRIDDAATSYEKAFALETDDAVKDFLGMRLKLLSGIRSRR